ncbi:hypothetical protein BGZ82_001786, partial [Podila clonocystis]
IEYVEEVVEEAEAEIIIKREQEVVVDEVVTKTETTTTVTEEEVVLHETTEKVVEIVEEERGKVIVKETIVETGVVAQPAVSKGSSWFKKVVSAGAGAVAVGAGAVIAGGAAVAYGAHHVASGAGSAASGALTKVDGVWKRTVQVLTTRKAHVDAVAPIAKTSYVYYDEDVYDAVLTEKHTGVTYVTQLLFDSKTHAYYVYVRWGETDYKLDGPHETIESAKAAFLITYRDQFGVEWETRETTVSERWTYEVKTYETYEEIEYVEEVVEETEAVTLIEQEREIVVQEQSEHVAVTEGEEIIKVVTTVKETGVVAQPAVSKGSSWFRRLATGAGAVASGALTQVDGVWKRTVQVLTTRKAPVDAVAPIAKSSYVYYDEEVYDAVLTEKHTGVTYVIQLLFDSDTHAYYVYVRWCETDYNLDGPHKTIEAAKAAFHVTYKERFGLEWETRETTVSERWTYEVKTYETFEETEYIEEVVEDYEVKEIVAREQQVIIEGKVVSTEQSVSSSHDDTVVRTVSEQVVSQEGSASSSSRGGAFGFGGSSSYEYTQTQSEEETKKSTFLANLPTLNAGVNADTGAAIGVIDLTSGTAETLRELPAHLRPRAWVSLRIGGWQDAPHELQGFMRLDDQSGQRLMESARDEAQGNAQETTPIDNLSLPEIVGVFAQKLYGHFGEELPKELEIERLRCLIEECSESGKFRKVIGAVSTGNAATTTRHGTKMVGSGSGSRGEESSASRSVLVLGKTQAGKSTFIEFVKNYANQQYTIDESLLGTRFKSKTRMPMQFVVKTELRAYEVFDANGTRIDIGSLGDQYQDLDDYFDALNDRKTTLKSVSHDHDSSPLPRDVEITFLDTPGVEDTNGRDVEHAKRVIDAMTQLQSFNLIIIVINCEETPSKAHQLAFRYYSKVVHSFQGHHSNIVFLYTHVEYEKCHHGNADYLSTMELRHKAFSQLFRCEGSYNHEDVSKAAVETYPMYNIDFDKRQRPIKQCMRLMTLRAILTHIVNSPAVALDTSASNLQQIHAITHPDEPNHALREKLPEVTHAILEQGQGSQDDVTVVPRAVTLGVDSSGACNKDRAIDLVASVRENDYIRYFSKTMSDCSSSGEDDDDRSDVLDFGARSFYDDTTVDERDSSSKDGFRTGGSTVDDADTDRRSAGHDQNTAGNDRGPNRGSWIPWSELSKSKESQDKLQIRLLEVTDENKSPSFIWLLAWKAQQLRRSNQWSEANRPRILLAALYLKDRFQLLICHLRALHRANLTVSSRNLQALVADLKHERMLKDATVEACLTLYFQLVNAKRCLDAHLAELTTSAPFTPTHLYKIAEYLVDYDDEIQKAKAANMAAMDGSSSRNKISKPLQILDAMAKEGSENGQSLYTHLTSASPQANSRSSASSPLQSLPSTPTSLQPASSAASSPEQAELSGKSHEKIEQQMQKMHTQMTDLLITVKMQQSIIEALKGR